MAKKKQKQTAKVSLSSEDVFIGIIGDDEHYISVQKEGPYQVIKGIYGATIFRPNIAKIFIRREGKKGIKNLEAVTALPLILEDARVIEHNKKMAELEQILSQIKEEQDAEKDDER